MAEMSEAAKKFLRDLHKSRQNEARSTGRTKSDKEVANELRKAAAALERGKNPAGVTMPKRGKNPAGPPVPGGEAYRSGKARAAGMKKAAVLKQRGSSQAVTNSTKRKSYADKSEALAKQQMIKNKKKGIK